MAETATLEANPDTLAVPEPATSPEPVEEAAAPVSGETEGSEQGEEQKAPSRFEGKSPEEIEAIVTKELEDAAARARQSEKDSQQAAAKKQADADRQARFVRDQEYAQKNGVEQMYAGAYGVAMAAIEETARALDKGEDAPKQLSEQLRGSLANVVTGALSSARYHAVDTVVKEAQSVLAEQFPGHRWPEELAGEWAGAVQTYDYPAMARTFFKLGLDAQQAKLRETWRAEWEAEQNGKAVAAKKAKDLEEVSGKKEPGPFRGGGGAAGASNPDAVMATAHPLSKEYAVAYKQKYGFDAPQP